MSWKTYTFDELLHSAYADKKINNVISIGDAEYEYNALINLYKDKNKEYIFYYALCTYIYRMDIQHFIIGLKTLI